MLLFPSKEYVMISYVNEHCDGGLDDIPLSTEAPMAHMAQNLHYSSVKILYAEIQITLSNCSVFTKKISLSHHGGSTHYHYMICFVDIKSYLGD